MTRRRGTDKQAQLVPGRRRAKWGTWSKTNPRQTSTELPTIRGQARQDFVDKVA